MRRDANKAQKETFGLDKSSLLKDTLLSHSTTGKNQLQILISGGIDNFFPQHRGISKLQPQPEHCWFIFLFKCWGSTLFLTVSKSLYKTSESYTQACDYQKNVRVKHKWTNSEEKCSVLHARYPLDLELIFSMPIHQTDRSGDHKCSPGKPPAIFAAAIFKNETLHFYPHSRTW